MHIQIQRKSNKSISEQIVDALRNGIDTGWYKAGDKLPSIRQMSKELEVSAMTVVKAYERLEKSGYVEKIHGKGIFVRKQLETIESDNNHGLWQDNVRDYVTRSKYAHRIVQFDNRIVNMSTAALHKRFLPTEKVLEMFQDNQEHFHEDFGRYPPVEGHYKFRKEIQKFFNQKDVACKVDQLIITSGSQLGIHLVAETFVGPGDVVIVGAPTFPGAIDVFKSRGAVVIDVPVDQEGMKTDNLMAICEQYPVKLLYVMATYQNPTGVSMSLDRSLELLELAEEYNFMILEDDSWSDISLERPVRPLKGLDDKGRVLYLGGFSKTFGPSFRISALMAEGSLYTRLVAEKSNIDSGAPLINQLMLTPYMNSIEQKQHHTWLCHELKSLRDRVVQQLKRCFPKNITFKMPQGGLVFWITLPSRFDGKLLYYRCLQEEKISILLGANCYSSIRGENQIRICYTYEEECVVMKSIEKIGKIIYELYEGLGEQVLPPMF